LGLVLLSATTMGLLGTPALADVPPLRGVGFDESLGTPAVLADALNQARMTAKDLPVYARIVLAPADLDAHDGPGAHFENLDERIERYFLKSVPVIVAIKGDIGSGTGDAEGSFWAAMALRYRGRVKAYEIGEHAEGSTADARQYAYALKQAAVQLRAADPDALILQGSIAPVGAVAWEKAVYTEDAAPYFDAVVISGSGDEATTLPEIETFVSQESPKASLVITALPLAADIPTAVRQILETQLSRLTSKAALTTYTTTTDLAAAVLPALERLKGLMSAELVALDDKSSELKMMIGGADVSGAVSHALSYDVNDLTTYLVYRQRDVGADGLDITVRNPVAPKVKVRDALDGRTIVIRNAVWDPKGRLIKVHVPLSDHSLILELAYGESGYASHADVSAKDLPSVAEIVYHHQLAQAAQDSSLSSYIATARMETHFRPSTTDPGFDVVTTNRFYSDKEASEWEETEFFLNGTRWGAKRPPFPLLQPEKVLSLPLDLRLNKDYRYRLVGVERVGARDCYIVRFEPMSETASFYRGTIWIDTKTFVKVKVQSTQTHLAAPVVSSEETQYFDEEGTDKDPPACLLSRFTTRQLMLVAGRNLLVERMVRFSEFQVNPMDFAAQREASRASTNVMYRDTDKGLRYFVKKGDRRVVEERPTTSAKALAFGATFDPSFDYPLPIVGINYLDFHFLNKDTQLALLFAGVLALGNVQHPKAIGDKIDASVDFFAIAVPVNDQIFGGQGEVRSERLRDIPLSVGINLGYQGTSFQKLLANCQLRFDAYSRDSQTAADFKPPPSTVTIGLGGGYEYRRGGYSLVANGTYYRRGTWRSWGNGEDFSPDQRRYEKFSISLSKDFFFRAVHKVHLNAAYYGGNRLDRFSSYQFGMFDDNRIHGVPSAGVRFSDLAMIRGGYSFNLLDLYRLDLFVDQALGRERLYDDRWRPITGLGLGVNTRFLFGTLFRGEIGKSLLPDLYKGSGSVVAQIMILKPI
jgi:hypothetical protein